MWRNDSGESESLSASLKNQLKKIMEKRCGEPNLKCG